MLVDDDTVLKTVHLKLFVLHCLPPYNAETVQVTQLRRTVASSP